MKDAGAWVSRLIDASKSVAGFVLRAGVVFAVAGIVVWTIPAFPIGSPVGVIDFLWRVVLLLIFVAPAGVTLLFGAGLLQLARVPPQLVEKAVEGTDHAKALIRQPVSSDSGRIANFRYLAGGLWRIGRTSLDAKDTVLGGVAIVRLFNPIVLVVTLISVVLGTLLSVVGAIRGLWWILS